MPTREEFTCRVRLIPHIYPADLPLFPEDLEELKKRLPYKEMEFKLSDGEGRYKWFRLRASSQFDALGQVSRVTGMLADVDEQRRTVEALQYQTERDGLTRLYNRRQARKLIDTMLEKPLHGSLNALLILDVDNSKQINDDGGHMFGDMVLRNVVDVLDRQFRGEDILSRIGGDEFLIFMTCIPDVDTVRKHMSMVLVSIQEMFTQRGIIFHPTCSIGAALHPNDGLDFTTLFQRADLAMYAVKDKGESRYQVYDSSTGRGG